jgi:hypothetical protein
MKKKSKPNQITRVECLTKESADYALSSLLKIFNDKNCSLVSVHITKFGSIGGLTIDLEYKDPITMVKFGKEFGRIERENKS